METGRPISYVALEVGTPVVSSSGTQFGTVEGHRFVDRDQIDEITVDSLPEPRGTLVLHREIARDEGPRSPHGGAGCSGGRAGGRPSSARG
jgi:hypothetical protein